MEENQTFDSPTLGLPNVRGFKIAALNIASLPGHIEELKTYMALKPIDIQAVNEARLDDSVSSSEMSIPGYCLERNDVLFPKRERVFHRGIQTPRNK